MSPWWLYLAGLASAAGGVPDGSPESPEAAIVRLNADAGAALEAGRAADALELYRAAALILSAMPERTPDRARALYLVGHCLEALGRPQDALDAYRESLALAPPGDLTARLARRLAALADSADGHLVFACDGQPRIEIDGLDARPRCGAPFAVAPGTYDARVTSDAGRVVALTIAVEPGRIHPVQVRFPEPAIAAPAAPADPIRPDLAPGGDVQLETEEGRNDALVAWTATAVTVGLLAGAGAAEWAARDAAGDYERAYLRFDAALAAPDGREAARAARGDAIDARGRFEAAAAWRTGLLIASLASAGLTTWAWLERQPVQIHPTVDGLTAVWPW